MERFFGVLVEHYAGDFPLWLCPVQCEVVVVADDVPAVLDLAGSIADRLRAAGLRVAVSARPGERMQARVRSAELRKVPYVVVVGRKDAERGDDVVRVRDNPAAGRPGDPRDAVVELVGELRAEAAKRGPEAAPPKPRGLSDRVGTTRL